MHSEYRDYLLEQFHGEVHGESFFRSMGEYAQDADHKYKWQVLAQLERETKEVIRSALVELDVHPLEKREDIERGERDARRFSTVPWRPFMKGFRAELEQFVAKFEAGEKLAPDSPRHRELVRHITTHERALLTFAIREREGLGDTSLEAIVALLKEPGCAG